MKTPPSNSDERWEKLLQQARRDAGPAVNLPALLSIVRQAADEPRPGWATDFLTLFASNRVVPACLVASGAVGVFAAWQAWELWQVLPWAQLIATTTGGGQ